MTKGELQKAVKLIQQAQDVIGGDYMSVNIHHVPKEIVINIGAKIGRTSNGYDYARIPLKLDKKQEDQYSNITLFLER